MPDYSIERNFKNKCQFIYVLLSKLLFVLKKSNIPQAMIITGIKIIFTPFSTVATYKKSKKKKSDHTQIYNINTGV